MSEIYLRSSVVKSMPILVLRKFKLPSHEWMLQTLYTVLPFLVLVGCFFYGSEAFGLQDNDKLTELKELTTEVGKLTKTGCYIAGGVSSLVGLVWSIAAQNLKILAASAVITVFAFKAPALFTGTLLI